MVISIIVHSAILLLRIFHSIVRLWYKNLIFDKATSECHLHTDIFKSNIDYYLLKKNNVNDTYCIL